MGRARASQNVYHAIADPTRRRVLEILTEGPRTVTDLQRATGAGQSALSQHLAVLRRARLVQGRRQGRFRRYSVLHPTPLREVADWVGFFDRFWDDRLARLTEHLQGRR